MTDRSPSSAKRPTTKRTVALRASMLGATAMLVAGCSNIHSSSGTYDPRFMNYEQRHALSLRQQEATLPLLVGANATGLTSGDRTALSGFMQSYAAQGEGALRIRVPQGSANAHAATHALGDIHDVVSQSGGNPSAVRVERYHVGNAEAHAPIVVIYDRLEATTNPCGAWSDRFNPPGEQSDYYNFGCASQANFGAALADPRDLIRPRGVGHPDAGRRAEVLAAYRRGEPTATERSSEAEATVSQVGE